MQFFLSNVATWQPDIYIVQCMSYTCSMSYVPFCDYACLYIQKPTVEFLATLKERVMELEREKSRLEGIVEELRRVNNDLVKALSEGRHTQE